MKRLFLISLLAICVACNTSGTTEEKSIDEIGFSVLYAIKNNDKQQFLELFDPTVLANTPQDKLDTAFEFYKTVLNDYDFPTFDAWTKNRPGWQIDTVRRVFAIALPLMNINQGKVDFIFEMQYSSENKIMGIALNKTADPSQMPEGAFPLKEEAFDYSFNNLESIRLYYLPGLNSDPQLSQSRTFSSAEFNDTIRNDFGNILNHLNASSIVNAEKTVSQQKNSKDLKAVIFAFNDNGRERNLFLVSNYFTEKSLTIDVFYTTNAAYTYQVNDSNAAQLTTDINELMEKYLK
jgi:hypothetical protein